MKFAAIVSIVFLLSFFQLNAGFSQIALTKEDSVALFQRKKALADFSQGKFTIPAQRVGCNSFYAEEVFFKISHLKVEFKHDWNMCGTGMDEYYYRERCYNSIIDSLMYQKYGRDIYYRITEEANIMELHDPDRYPSDDDPFAMAKIRLTNAHDSILSSHVHYPPAAKRDSVDGKVSVRVDFDSTGKIIRTSIMRGVRPDLDSAALSGVSFIPSVQPDFRWGVYQSGSIIIPIQFALKD